MSHDPSEIILMMICFSRLSSMLKTVVLFNIVVDSLMNIKVQKNSIGLKYKSFVTL